MRVLIRWLTRGDSGQDLVEYTLLLAFVVLGTTALMNQSNTSTSGIWGATNLALQGQLISGTGGGTSSGSPSNSTSSSSSSSSTSSSGTHHGDDDGEQAHH